MEHESWQFPLGRVSAELIVPQYMKEIVAEMTHLARRSPDVNQRSGVSVRVSISNYENVLSNALKRAVRLNETTVVPRVSDLPAMMASTTGKIELETIGDTPAEKIVDKLIQSAVVNVFNRYFLVQEFDDVVHSFEGGLTSKLPRLRRLSLRHRGVQVERHEVGGHQTQCHRKSLNHCFRRRVHS